MSDKQVVETKRLDGSKESEVENVDAIKRYIEEQEVFLRCSSDNEIVNKKIKDTYKGENQNNSNLELQLTFSNNCDIASKDCEMKQQMYKTGSESVYSDESTMSASPNALSNDSLLDLENEETLANQAAANLLSLGQNCLKMQINIKQQNRSDEDIQSNAHEFTLKSNVNIQNKEECHSLELHQERCELNDKSEIELNSTNKTSKTTEDDLHPSKEELQKNQDCSNEISEPVNKNSFSKSENFQPSTLLHKLLTASNKSSSEINNSIFLDKDTKTLQDSRENGDESLSIATSVMDMILNDAEVAISKKTAGALSKQCFSPEKANSSVSLAIGSKVEAKDFCELWHPAQIVEVDCEEMEVLVQYDKQPKMHNEWISISSPRLRPISSMETKPASPSSVPVTEVVTEPKAEDKQKVTFAVGERCLARWRDNRRFIATVQNDLENGQYEVMFDDGFQWKCPVSRMYKLKENGHQDYPRFGATGAAPAAAAPPRPPRPRARRARRGPAPAAPAPLPLYHTHLFDPTRDYLGSKSERREMKRKLNIKEIFNIGQKRKKLPAPEKEYKSTVPVKEEIKTEIKSDPDILPQETAPLAEPPLKETISKLQVKKVIPKKPSVKKKSLGKKKNKLKNIDGKAVVSSSNDIKKEKIPEAVASIIGTMCNLEPEIEVKNEPSEEAMDSNANEIHPGDLSNESDLSHSVNKQDLDIVMEEEIKPFEVQDGVEHEEVIGKIKEVITKLEDGINQVEKKEIKTEEVKVEVPVEDAPPAAKPVETNDKEKQKKSKGSSKVKKGKKLRLMQEKKVKKQVEKVKCQLEEMKKQVEAMRQEIMLKTEELASSRRGECAAPEAALLPGEWCARWLDGQPEGAVSEAPAAGDSPLPRRSVLVEDKRLPPGWTKHMVRRSLGSSAGKWDVVLVSPENRRLHTKSDMRMYLENNPQPALKPFEAALMDFGIHLKLSRRLGWVRTSAAGAPPPPPPSRHLPASSPLLKRSKLSLHGTHKLLRHKKPKLKIKPLRPPPGSSVAGVQQSSKESSVCTEPTVAEEAVLDGASIKDGFVDVGSLRVQVISTLLRCPAEGCFKNFRNTTLLKMHIKHYHRELRKSMGNTPKVLDLAYARTRPSEAEMKLMKREAQQRVIKVKLPRLHKRVDAPAPAPDSPAPAPAVAPAPAPAPAPPPAEPAADAPPRSLDSPKLRDALAVKPAKRPRVLLPVRTKDPDPPLDPEPAAADTPPPLIKQENLDDDLLEPKQEIPDCGTLDFETAICSHTVTKMMNGERMKSEKRRKTFACLGKLASEDEEWAGASSDTRSSYPSCGTPDSARADADDPVGPADALAAAAAAAAHHYMYTENGERIKLVRMKREEIINCHCGFREEDGLMVQCELCLCWQHALCHNIQREAEVPEKYTCSICLNPRRGRRRQRFMHDQDRLYEGLLPGPGGGRACDALRRSHELSGNLLRIEDALHAVRVNTRVAQTKNHPKLYLWARDWETVELSFAQEKLNSEYSDLNVIINNLGKENLPMKVEDLKEIALDMKTPSDEPEEKQNSLEKENQMGSQGLLSGLLSSPGAASLDLPISESELEKLAKSVHEHESRARVRAPQPEAAIENSACRARLLRHIQRCHALLDQRLDSIEAQVAELESQDASLEDDESPEFCPRAKQALVMIARDLDAMEELGVVT
ncbi:uncharacterized protein LOC125240622 isoform X2 [Leguminivora glycinivorella]|uniref:uncharacterized protein LOC125240622 isoform X2 n=1 Tax=Leguminivora glycinivorella TaxID=1035111 RepID=UPI00200D9F21|nr:uncharacterized protein LOC125240622 isoform X2 [Leguminivora glycinivorella]